MSPQRQFAIDVVKRLREAGFEALWAGGCVRDQILGFTPKDYDVATSAVPEQIRNLFGRRKTLAIGQAFGVITVLGPKSAGQIEVATFRNDATYSDGRHPDSVTFSTARADAQRRDFTINGLFFDPLRDEVIDYVGGQADLQGKIVRAIGDPLARISEDKLRMLRAVRIAATFDFRIDRATFSAIKHQAGEIVIVSAERIAAELRRMLTHDNRTAAMEMLRESGLMEIIVAETKNAFATGDQPADERKWQETLWVLRSLNRPTFSAAFAAFLHKCVHRIEGRDSDIRHICRRLKLTNHECEGVEYLMLNAPLIRNARRTPWPILQRTLITPRASELLSYAEAMATVYDNHTQDIDFCRAKQALPPAELNPPQLLTGEDLIAIGLRPGPKFRSILEEIRDRQLAGEITTRQQAIEQAKQTAKSVEKQFSHPQEEGKKTR